MATPEYTNSQNAIRDVVGPRLSRGHSNPSPINMTPNKALSECTDSPRRGAFRYGITKPSNDVKRNSTTPIWSSRWPWRDKIFDDFKSFLLKSHASAVQRLRQLTG